MTQASRTPGSRIARSIHVGTTVLLPHHSGQPGRHDSFYAVSDPYEECGEWWVEVTENRGDADPFPIALHEASLPI